ncbi:MAG: phospholipid carrier-dependent glycosyltransferase [Anaerolineae bacterium]|nr:phospholipid carrier-dependent glycosyltransferase [Anaerolineae bacterium]
MSNSRKRLADGAFLLALMLYILLGAPRVPEHGDEYMQMSMARDWFGIVEGRAPQQGYVAPDAPDGDMMLRLINGVLGKYTIGMTWQLAGLGKETLPGVYVWEMPRAWNQENGTIPTSEALRLARWPSALMTALGLIPIFILGWHLRLRSMAYPAALLYALHPVILLNGRRAMLEGSLILFSLLTMAWLVAIIVAEHSASATGFLKRMPAWLRYAILGLLIGLTVAAKHTGLLVAAGALGAAMAAAVWRARSWRAMLRVALAGLVALGVWFALNPGFWRDPVGALRLSLAIRADLLDSQARGSPFTYRQPSERVAALIAAPFLTAPQYFESPDWGRYVGAQVTAYQASAVNGWDWGPVIGIGLTMLAALGLGALVVDALRGDLVAWVILAWAAAVMVGSLAIPFAWQRYYLPLMLVYILLAASGLGRLLVRRSERAAPASGGAATEAVGVR